VDALLPRPLDPTEAGHRAARSDEALRFLDIAVDFRTDGWPDKAKRFARRALTVFERESRTHHPDAVRARLCLAGAREDLGDYARAKADYRCANDILDEWAAGTNNLEVQRLRIRALRGLAGVVCVLGRDQQAKTMLKHALALAERSFGWNHADVASVLNDLGVHYRLTGRYEKAERVHRRALAMTEKLLGPEHPQVATILHQLSVLEHARGRFAAGEPFARRAVTIREKTFGPDHPEVAIESEAIATLLEEQRKYEEAALMCQHALTIRERWFGPDHHEAVKTANHLVRILRRPVDERREKQATDATRCA
jgi:tetratricopeptide (TPR) repeat protein